MTEIVWNESRVEPEFYSYHDEDIVTIGCSYQGFVFTHQFTKSEWRNIIEQELGATSKTPLPNYLDES